MRLTPPRPDNSISGDYNTSPSMAVHGGMSLRAVTRIPDLSGASTLPGSEKLRSARMDCATAIQSLPDEPSIVP